MARAVCACVRERERLLFIFMVCSVGYLRENFLEEVDLRIVKTSRRGRGSHSQGLAGLIAIRLSDPSYSVYHRKDKTFNI
jgi:hypothetical protein